MLRRWLAAISAAFGLASGAAAEPIGFFQVEGVSYDPSVPAPEAHFGYEIGERPVRYDLMVSYLREIAEGSDRISVETIGYSHEHRPILFFVVTSPENHARIDEIRETHRARLAGEAEPDAAPMVLWVNYGVHGAESSAMDAAIPALYHFAAARGDEVDAMLEDAVILVTAVFNPDGHARRIDHVNTFWSQTEVSDPAHQAHQLWIQARTNHYWFDLNRQWLPVTQPEAEAWIAKWHEWKPMVSADYHEMGSDSPFYFHPGEALRRNPLIPERARELTQGIGERHAAFLDSEARLYATEEVFDNFYIGKGSTYPQVNGSLGILFEIGAARGGAVETERGLVTHADNVRTQFRTTLTTIQGALDQRAEITAYQRDFFQAALQEARNDRRRGFVFTAEGDPARAARFVKLLNQHDVDVHRLARDVRAGGRDFAAGDAFVVPLEQDQYVMIRGLFDQPTEFPENIFYDVSGWTMPLAYDLDYAELRGAFNANLLGERVSEAAPAPAAPTRAPYGYAFSWAESGAPRLLHDLLEAGLYARGAMEPITVATPDGEASLPRGSIFVPLQLQEKTPAAIHDIVRRAASEAGVRVHPAARGTTPEPGRDLGAWNVIDAVEEPRALILFGSGIAHYDAGEMWWTLDQRFGMPVTLRDTDALGGLDWSRYTHVIFAGGDGNLSEAETERLRQWIREEGGTLIATRAGAHWAQRTFLDADDAQAEDETAEAAAEADEAGGLRFDFAERDVREAEHVIGGALFALDLDTSHPLGFGFADRSLAVMRNTTDTLSWPSGDPYAIPAVYAEEPLLAGYASQRRIGEIAGTPAIVARELGRGQVIALADNPVFRGMFPGAEKLLANALFFSGFIENARGDYAEAD